nr:hypothetical protein BaRGS_006237 [Batillaria attramentaria]
MLPWWCRDVAWCTVGLICISCTLVSALAGLKLGDKWVYHWAYVATMSVFQQLCAEPLFLIILSAIAIFVSNKGRNVKWEFSLDLEDIASDFRPRRAKSKPTALYTPARFHYPESVHQGYAITRRLQEEDYALGVVGEVVSYLTFFIIVLMASTGQHSVHQYLTTVVVREMFVEGGFANASIAPQESAEELHDIVTWGQRGWYSGGGYAVDLPMHVEEAQQVIYGLHPARTLKGRS